MISMVTIPGTQVKLQFFTFPSKYPPLYEAAGQGSLNLASVNAGNADGLCVGLGGVNGGFYLELTKHANQQRVNLSPNQACQPGNYDDYQDRHLKLIAQAAGGTSSAAYTNTDPCAFSYVNARLISQAPGYYEGAAFVDVFDPSRRPNGNAKNVSMLYLAPPFDGNHASQSDFLQAIEATAEKIIETLAGYNTLAAQQNLPVIEALRNTLFSSNLYNKRLSVKTDLIAGAILAGFTSALLKNPVPGLVELQFPVGHANDPLFASLQSGLAAPSTTPHVILLVPKDGGDDNSDDNNNGDNANQIELRPVDGDNVNADRVQVAADSLAAALAPVRAAANSLNQIIQLRQPVQLADTNYGVIPQFKNQYEAADSLMSDDAPVNLGPLPLNAASLACSEAGLRAVKAGNEIVQAEGDWQKITKALADLDLAVSDADASRNNAINESQDYPSPSNKSSAQHANEIADNARKIRDAMPKLLRKGNRAELAKTTGRNAKIALAITGILGLAGSIVAGATLGGLIGTRTTYQPNSKKISIAIGDKAATISLGDDPPPPEGLTISGAYLLDPSSKDKVATLIGNDGSWAVTNPNEISYTVKNRTKASIQYVLEFSDALSGLAAHYSEPANIEIDFIPASPIVPGDTTDITVLAPDRTSAVPVPVPTGSILAAGPSPDQEAKWDVVFNPNGTTSIVFTPNKPTSVTKRTTCELNGKIFNIVVLLPNPPIPLQTAIPRINPPAVTIFDDSIDMGVELNLIDASGKEQKVITVAEIEWSVLENNQIAITKTALRNETNSLSVPYTLKYADKITPAATLTLNFASAATPEDISITTADRSKPVRCPLPGIPILGMATGPNGGTWSTDGSPYAIYSFPSKPPTGEMTVTVMYALQAGAAEKKLTLTILPAPLSQTVTVSRSEFRFSSSYSYSPLSVPSKRGKVWLWNENKLVASFADTATGTRWSVDNKQPREIEFRADPNVFKPNINRSVSVEWALVTNDARIGKTTSARATLTLTLQNTMMAFSIPSPSQASRFKPVSISVLDHCLIPNGYQTIKAKNRTFGSTDSPTTGIWNLSTDSNGNPIVTVDASQALGSGVTLDYSVLDKTGAESNTATISVDFSAMDRYRPRASNCAVSTVPGPGVTIAVDVLNASTSYFAKDPASVKLLGTVDDGLAHAVPYAAVAKDGKSLGSPGQGTWIVDSNGLIVFQTDPSLNVPVTPAPVWYQFADTLGNLSTPGKVIVDPDTVHLPQLPVKMASLDDKAFWSAYQMNVSGVMPTLSSDEFIVVTAALAQVTLMCGVGGANPVSPTDYAAAYKAWYDAGEAWDDAPGSVTSIGLVAICERLVNTALGSNPSLPYASRYWRLELMARMAEQDAGSAS